MLNDDFGLILFKTKVKNENENNSMGSWQVPSG
jgi:hypothetical protein